VESPTKAGANPPVKRGLWTRSGLSASRRGWPPSAPLVAHTLESASSRSRRGVRSRLGRHRRSRQARASRTQSSGLRSAIWLRNPGGGAAPSLSKVSLSPWGRHQVPTASRLRDQLVACYAVCIPRRGRVFASGVCCQIAAKNDQVPFVSTLKGTLTRAFVVAGTGFEPVTSGL
jgi:hypothetical protein